MHTVAHIVRLGIIAHFHDIAFQRIQIQHKAGGLDIGLVHARLGGNIVANFKIIEIHALLLSLILPGQLVEVDIAAGDDNAQPLPGKTLFVPEDRGKRHGA